MSILVANCPRCGAQQISFDSQAAIYRGKTHDWQRWFEMFCVCRNCKGGTIFVVKQKEYDRGDRFSDPSVLLGLKTSLNNFVEVDRFISLRDQAAQASPDYVPPDIQKAFNEAATCLAVQCWNAAGAMFRLCVDLATRPMLPALEEEEAKGLNAKTRRDLGLRVQWLFDNGRLPQDLRELAKCIREDGNDGAHTGMLNELDADDLLDFTTVLLERLYTEPKRLELADDRRKARRKPKSDT